MTSAVQSGALDRPTSSSLADVIDTILDKGLVLDAYVRVSLVGIELLTIDARVVIASVDTYLKFAEAVNRLDLEADQSKEGLPELMNDVQEGGARSKTKGALEAAGETLRDITGGGDEKPRRRDKSRRRDEEEE